jgi:hypothetical protein
LDGREDTMNISTTIPATVQIGRGRLFGLIGVVAALAAVITWMLLALAFDNGTPAATSNVQTDAVAPISSARQDARRVPSIMSLTPARLAAGALGTGYALPRAHSGPTMESVLSSMSSKTRRDTEAVTALTFERLAAGAAGSP